MAEAARTYVVECFVPDVDDAAVRRAADATAAEIRRLGPGGGDVEYLGALLMAVDEVVLHAFRASDPELVRRVIIAAGLSFARIVESVAVTPVTS
jgi:hypothetical protein